MRKSLELITIIALIISTVLVGIVSLQSSFRVSGTERNDDTNVISIYFNKPIPRDLDLTKYISSIPSSNLSFNNVGNRIEILLSNLSLGETYNVKVDRSLPNLFNETLNQDTIVEFSTKNPKFAYLRNKDGSFAIHTYDLKTQEDVLQYATSNEIRSYSITRKYLLVAELQTLTDIKVSLIDIATKDVVEEINLSQSNLFKVELSDNNDFFIYISQDAKSESGFVIPLGSSKLTRVEIDTLETINFSYNEFTNDILDAYITPDNEAMLLRGFDSTFYIKSFLTDDEPITLAKFIGTGGFNSKGSQIIFTAFDPTLAFSSFPYISIYNSDRSTEDIKIEGSYVIDSVFGGDSSIYYAKKVKELLGTPGFFGIYNYKDNAEKVVIQDDNLDTSFELPILSQDDNYLCYESYSEAAMMDNSNQRSFINQRKPKNASVNIFEFQRKGNVIEIPNSYDCRWI